MFRNNAKNMHIQKGRHVVLAIKATGFKPEDGHRMTQIACVEMINGKLTGNNFSSFIKVENKKLFEECKTLYRETNALKTAQAEDLITSLEKAPAFKDVQQQLLAYLNQDPTTKIIVHFKKFVLDFMRQHLDKSGLEAFSRFKIENMISKAAKLSHQHQYHGGTYPAQVNSDREKTLPGRTFYKLEQICTEFKVSTRLRTGFDAAFDANLLARAEHNRLAMKAENAMKDVPENAKRLSM